MRYAMSLAVAAMAPMLAGCAGASVGSDEWVFAQTVRSGALARLGDYRSLSKRDCRTVSLPEVSVVEPPRHGAVTFGAGPARYVRDPSNRVEHRCDRAPGTAVVLYYRSTPGYRGADALAYRVRFANGETTLYRKRLTVR
jgi:hypothetical protein